MWYKLDRAPPAGRAVNCPLFAGNHQRARADWTPIRIEQMTDENVLILLNDGIGAILTAYEIVETVS